MKLAKELYAALGEAGDYVREHHYEYITPEIFLLMLLDYNLFRWSFEACGGDLDLLKEDLCNYIKEYMEPVEENAEGKPGKDESGVIISVGMRQMIELAEENAFCSQVETVEIPHIIHAICKLEHSYAKYYLLRQGMTEEALLREMLSVLRMEEEEDGFPIGGEESYEEGDQKGEELSFGGATQISWTNYAPCLNDTLTDVNPLIGREAELERTIQILCRKDKNNPLHLGEPGVGKTAITYGLVQKIKEGNVPKLLKNAKVYSLDLGGMIAGTQYRGDFEKRIKRVLTEIEKEEAPIIYIDEIHNLAGAGAVGESSLDASNLLKPYLAAGKIRFIGATTYEEYKKYFEKSKSLVRRFQCVDIGEPSVAETVEILEGLQQRYEDFHGVVYEKGVLDYAAQMSAKHINERFLPDKAIDLIDEAGAYVKLHPVKKRKTQTVDQTVINEVLTKICRVPIETVENEETEGLANLEKRLKQRVFGQDEAISQVVNAVKFSKAGLSEENKPLASLLFVGPTGVGKTEIAKSLAEELGVKLLRFDMSEYREKHTVAKLIGAPAGYVGYEEGGLLTEAVRKHPSSVVLLDEIEKAHEDIYNVLLQVMDYATLTDNQGRKADFRNVVVIMTSNAGASLLGKGGIGFGTEKKDAGVVMDTVKDTFQPEFRNRLNKIVLFQCMDETMAGQIVEKKLQELAKQLLNKNIRLTADQKAKALIQKKGISTEFGAREVDRVIRNEVKTLFVDEILFGQLKNGGTLKLSAKEGSFLVTSKAK